MARPTKQGIDYFPLDCQFDDKTEMFLLEKEAIGLAFLVTIWQLIYSNEGYYTVSGNDLCLLIKKRINVEIDEINDCIKLCLDRSVFDKELYNQFGILTSKAVQKRYFDASKKKKIVRFNVNYLINGINVNENSIDVSENKTNVNVDADVKEKVNKKEEVKGIEFSEIWNLYDKKIGNQKELKFTWNNLTIETQKKILDNIPKYKEATPNKKYRKNLLNYFKDKVWEDESIEMDKPSFMELLKESKDYTPEARRKLLVSHQYGSS